jgi:hypothetical protein
MLKFQIRDGELLNLRMSDAIVRILGTQLRQQFAISASQIV